MLGSFRLLGAEACSGQGERGVLHGSWGRGRGSGNSLGCVKATPGSGCTAPSVGASVSRSRLSLSHFCLQSRLERARLQLPGELSCFSSTWWLVGLWRRRLCLGQWTLIWPGRRGLRGHRHIDPCPVLGLSGHFTQEGGCLHGQHLSLLSAHWGVWPHLHERPLGSFLFPAQLKPSMPRQIAAVPLILQNWPGSSAG